MFLGWSLHIYDFRYSCCPQILSLHFPKFQILLAKDHLDSYIWMSRRQLKLKLYTNKHHLFSITNFLFIYTIFTDATKVSKLENWKFSGFLSLFYLSIKSSLANITFYIFFLQFNIFLFSISTITAGHYHYLLGQKWWNIQNDALKFYFNKTT